MNIDALTAYLALSSGSYSGILRDMYAVHNLGLNPDLHTKLLANRFVGGTKELSGTPPLSFKSKGKPLTAWSITGNTVQNGTPTPENPVEVQAVGDRTGNLFDKNTITVGNFATVSGTTTNNAYYCSDFIPITATTYYFQNAVGRNYQNTVVVYDANKQGLRYAKLSGGDKVSGAIAFQSGDAYIRINCYYQTDVDTVMVNIGSTALPYEPYGYKIPVVTSADGTEPITTPIYLDAPLYKIGDYADKLSKTEEVRVVKEMVFTGEENWHSQYGGFTVSVTKQSGKGTVLSTHYIASTSTSIDKSVYGNSTNVILIFDSDYTTLADFKAYLAAQYAAGTPVKVYYVMKTPETKTVEPVEIPTLNGTTVIDVDTAVKPENMTIKYRR